jgi:hypothetical protein
MTRHGALAIVVLGPLALAGCESSQARSARLRAAASHRAPERGLRIARTNPDARAAAATLVNDPRAGRSAAVVELRNTSRRTLAALPLLFTVTGAGGKKLFSNDLPGASADLTTVPSLPAGDTLTWVNDAIVGVRGGRAVDARVGEPARPVPTATVAPPRLRVSGVHLERDPIDGVTAVGRIVNASPIPQQRLVIFATARRRGRIVAAGRAVVPLLRPGARGAPFTLFFVGDPTGARLRLQAPAVSLGRRP